MVRKSLEDGPPTPHGVFLHDETTPRAASAHTIPPRNLYITPENSSQFENIDLSNPTTIEGVTFEPIQVSERSLELVYFKEFLLKNISRNLPEEYDNKALENVINSTIKSYQHATELYGHIGLTLPSAEIAGLFENDSISMLLSELDKRRNVMILIYPNIPILEQSTTSGESTYEQLLKQSIVDKPSPQNQVSFWIDEKQEDDVTILKDADFNELKIVWNLSVVSDGGLEEEFCDDIQEYFAYQATMLSRHKFPSTTAAHWYCFTDHPNRHYEVSYSFDDKHQFNFIISDAQRSSSHKPFFRSNRLQYTIDDTGNEVLTYDRERDGGIMNVW